MALRHYAQLVTALIAFIMGGLAVLETFPTPPLLDLGFIYNTRPVIEGAALVFGLASFLMTPLTFRRTGRWQWVLAASIGLAAAGFLGGLLCIDLTTWGGA